MIEGSPESSNGPWRSMALMPYSLMLPATMPENTRRRFAARSCTGWSRASRRARMDSCVTSKGSWKSSGMLSSQLKP